MIPGSNLLNSALTVITSQGFGYIKFTGRATNAIGIDVPVYDPAVQVKGSIQAVPRSLFQHMGLDWKRNYIMIYCDPVILGVDRDSAGDRIEFDGKTYQVLSENDWQPMDSWQGLLCVEIPA